VNMQYGTSRSRVLRFPPARWSLMIPKIIDGDVRKLWAAGAFPYRQTSDAVVSNRSLTRM